MNSSRNILIFLILAFTNFSDAHDVPIRLLLADDPGSASHFTIHSHHNDFGNPLFAACQISTIQAINKRFSGGNVTAEIYNLYAGTCGDFDDQFMFALNHANRTCSGEDYSPTRAVDSDLGYSIDRLIPQFIGPEEFTSYVDGVLTDSHHSYTLADGLEYNCVYSNAATIAPGSF